MASFMQDLLEYERLRKKSWWERNCWWVIILAIIFILVGIGMLIGHFLF